MDDKLPDVKLMIDRLRNIDRQTMHKLGNYDGLMREAADTIERLSAQAPGMEAWTEAVVQFVFNYEYAAQRQATSAEIANALKAHLVAIQVAERVKA